MFLSSINLHFRKSNQNGHCVIFHREIVSKSAPILLLYILKLKVVEKWISDIEELHRNQPPPTIQYSKPMPDIDQLMQVSQKIFNGQRPTNILRSGHSSLRSFCKGAPCPPPTCPSHCRYSFKDRKLIDKLLHMKTKIYLVWRNNYTPHPLLLVLR